MIRNRLLLSLSVMLAITLTACTNSAATPTEPVIDATNEPQVVAVRPTVTAQLPVIPTPTQPLVNECLECHTDKQRLIDNAKPEEVKESESSGVG